MQLPNWHNKYLVLTAEDIPQDVGEDILGIVHIPGMSCHACGKHLDTAFIQHDGSFLRLIGKECTCSDDADAWYAAMKRARFYVEYPHFKAEQWLQHNQINVYRALALLSQLHPWMAEYSTMLQDVTATGSFSIQRMDRIKIMAYQLGGLDTLLSHRDQLRRLYLLEKISQDHFINKEEANTIISLLNQGRNQILTEKQDRLIHALMEKYSHERETLAGFMLHGWNQQKKVLTIE